MLFLKRFRGMIPDFRSDDSFTVKTGSRPTEMVDPSFDAEYSTYPTVLTDCQTCNLRLSQTCKTSTSVFIGEKLAENRKLMKLVVILLK